MNRPDWKELADDDGYEDGSFMVIGKVGPNEHIVDEQEMDNIVLEQSVSVESASTETPSPCELLPEEVRKIMEAPTPLPRSFPDITNSTVSLAESLTPSFVTGENPSLATNGSSLSNSSTEAIFDNATNQVAHLTEENQVLKNELEKHKELTKRNIETWREFQASATKQHQADKEKHEESRQLVLKLHEEKEQLKSQISVLESLSKTQEGQIDTLNSIESTFGKDELKSLEAKLSVKDDSLRRLKTLLEENEALLNEEKYQTELLKKILRDQEAKIAELQSSGNSNFAASNVEWEKEREENQLVLSKLRKDLECAKVSFEEILLKKDTQVEILKKEIEDLHLKLENLNEYNQNVRKDAEIAKDTVNRLEHQLRESQNENILLTTRVAAMKAENEQAVNLKQEMEAFRLDYLTERENRSKVEDEKSLLLLQLSSLKEELKISQDELDHLHKTHLTFATEHVNRADEIANVDNQASGSRVSNDNHTSLEEPRIPPCPMCGKDFGELSKLQKHAAICGLEPISMGFTDPFVFP